MVSERSRNSYCSHQVKLAMPMLPTTQLFPHLDADGADVTDDAGDGQVAQNGDFRGDGGIPAGHEIGQLVLETGDVDLQTVALVDEADFGADIPVGHAVARAREVNAGRAVLIGAAREINQMICRLQKFLDDRQAAGSYGRNRGMMCRMQASFYPQNTSSDNSVSYHFSNQNLSQLVSSDF